MKEFPSPNMIPHPITQNEMLDAANTMKFLARMLVVFFARHSPLSTIAKPAFIQKTRQAVKSTHTVSMPMRRELLLSKSAWSLSEVAPPASSCARAGAEKSASARNISMAIPSGRCR